MSNQNPRFSQFYQQLSENDVLASNRWKIGFEKLPGDILSLLNSAYGAQDNLANMTIWARGTQLPTVAQESATFSYQGQDMTIPTIAKLSNTTSLTFYAKADLEDYQAFEKWTSLMSNVDFNGRDSIGTGVAGGGDKLLWKDSVMTIDVMKASMKESTCTYKLVGLYPTNVGEISFTNDSPGLSEFTVDFNYQFWFRTEA